MTAKPSITIHVGGEQRSFKAALSSWQQGADAARAGHKAGTCPYPAVQYHFVTWLNGWAAAKHEMAKEADEL